MWSLAGSAGPPTLTADEIEHAFAVASRPVFVFGVHRSGTTLVRDLLDHHPALSVLPSEGTMFTHFAWHLKRLRPDDRRRFLGCEWLRRLANPINQQPYWLFGRSSEAGSPYVEFARALMAWWPLVEARLGQRIASWPLVAIALAYAYCTAGFRIGSPLRRWVEKTPTNERFLSRLTVEFPEAKLLHVVRHPCAVYASHRRAALNSGRSLSEGSRILRQMRRSYREAANRSARPASDAYLLLRYEDLLEDTPGSVHRMACFLGIQTLPVMMQPTVNGIPAPSNSSYGDDGPAGRLNHRPPGDAFGVLTRHDRERLGAMVGDSVERLGYQLEPVPALRRKWLRMMTQAEWVADRLKVRLARFTVPRPE
ncbi:MAG TPA: sulfotransferase [Rhodanobacteraceae bacterium]|nr:sulfotransferase [Rhodanobacteraceae bacterium]